LKKLLSSLLILTASLGASAAFAENAAQYPSKPVTLVVPFAAAGPTDALGRLIAQKLGERLGKPFIVVNRPGAGGNTGSASVATAPPDGYTLVLGTVSTHGINPSLYKNMPYDHRKDFIAISQLSLVPNVLVVNKDLPVKSVPELIAYLKKNPGKVFYATPGAGTSIHLASELFKMRTETDMTHVPYKGSGPAMIDVMGGQVQLMFDNSVTAWPQVLSGKVRAIAVSTPTRLKSAPDLPAIAEFLPGFEASAWHGVFAPAGTPRPIIDKLATEIQAIMKDPAVVAQLTKVDIIPVGNTPAEFSAFIDKETDRWAAVVKKYDLKAD
jgi:tripartite-type tricarboxylate transporter receptor subunit TctC